MDNLLVKWNGSQKLKGIVAVRNVFGLGLKQAIRLLDDNEGFVISQVQWIALRGEYMLKMITTGNSVRIPDRSINDWLVETYKPINPTWLVDHICRDPLTS